MKKVLINILILGSCIGFNVGVFWGIGWLWTQMNTKYGTKYETYQDACRENDFEAAHIFLDHLYVEYGAAVEHNTGFTTKQDGENITSAARDYCFAAECVCSAELRYLASLNEDMAWTRAVALVKEMPVVGRKFAEGTYSTSNDGKCYFIESYQYYVDLRNHLCNLLLDLAIDNKNQEIAEKVLKCYCENCREEYGLYYIYYNMDDLKAAQKKYDEAVASGAFE